MISASKCVQGLVEKATNSGPNTFSENTDLVDALGKVLAEDIHSAIDVPPSDNSAMDGYAFRSGDLEQSNTLPLSQRIQAGSSPIPLEPGTAARIFTGAEIPAGADTVEMQENCENADNVVEFKTKTEPGKNIRRQGQDIAKGDLVLKQGTALRPQELGLLASIGVDSVSCFRPLRVALMNTGDELVEPGQPLPTGKIYNSNRFLLDAVLKGWGFETVHSAISADNLQQTKAALTELATKADIVISTGGVSVGEEDHIKPAVESLGELDLWKVAIKPGKPFAFGHIANTPFIGLPGNPASVFVTLLILARPYLLSLQGLSSDSVQPKIHTAKAKFSRKEVRREEYLRARIDHDGVSIYPNQSSGVLSSATWGGCLAIQRKGCAIEEGEEISFIPYSSLLSI